MNTTGNPYAHARELYHKVSSRREAVVYIDPSQTTFELTPLHTSRYVLEGRAANFAI